jgi:phage protein D
MANGQRVTGAIEAEVISNNHYAADRFSTSIAIGSDLWSGFALWASEADILLEVQFSLDGGVSYTSMVQGAVDNVVINLSLGLIHVEGRDHTASLLETRTRETFANRTASEIATLLASRHNLSHQVSATATPVGRYYENEHDSITLDQFSHATTEWDLLAFLARQEGFDVFVQGQTLYFQPTTQMSDIAVSLRPADMIDLRMERSLTLARDIEVVVKSWNSRQNSAFIQRARAARHGGINRSSGQVLCYSYVRPNLTPDEALRFAQRKLVELTRHERTVEITMPGDLELTPRSILMLEGTGSDFDQAYFIDVIERRFHPSHGFSQHIRARNTSSDKETTLPKRSVN